MPALQTGSSTLTADDLHLFNEGTHQRLYEKLGASGLKPAALKAVVMP